MVEKGSRELPSLEVCESRLDKEMMGDVAQVGPGSNLCPRESLPPKGD